MEIIQAPLTLAEFKAADEGYFPDMIKGVEFDSLINIRPLQGDRSRGIEDPNVQNKIRNVVKKWIRD